MTPFLLKMAALFTRISTLPNASAAAVDRCLHLRLVRHVGGDGDRPPAGAVDIAGAVRRVLRAGVDRDDRCARLGQPLGDPAADIGARSGYERDFILQRS